VSAGGLSAGEDNGGRIIQALTVDPGGGARSEGRGSGGGRGILSEDGGEGSPPLGNTSPAVRVT